MRANMDSNCCCMCMCKMLYAQADDATECMASSLAPESDYFVNAN